MTHKIIGVTGFKNTGKTTMVERLVAWFTARGLRVATIKHAHHVFDIDHKGTDSWRHRKAGAAEVAIVSRNRWAVIHELDGLPEPPISEILAALNPCDLVIVEGYKRDTHDKIEMRNHDLDHDFLADSDPTIIAIASNGETTHPSLPVFARDNIDDIGEFVLSHLELQPK